MNKAETARADALPELAKAAELLGYCCTGRPAENHVYAAAADAIQTARDKGLTLEQISETIIFLDPEGILELLIWRDESPRWPDNVEGPFPQPFWERLRDAADQLAEIRRQVASVSGRTGDQVAAIEYTRQAQQHAREIVQLLEANPEPKAPF